MFNCLNRSIKCLCLGLLALFTCQANAGPLEGIWQHDRQQTTIKAGPNFKFLFCNEQNNCAEGFYRGGGVIVVPQWQVTGRLNGSKNLISWSNGTQWLRYSQPRGGNFGVQYGQEAIASSWVHDGRPTAIQMQDRVRFILINEAGQRSEGMMVGKELVIPSLNIRGRLHKHGNVIKWSNGTTWYRAGF